MPRTDGGWTSVLFFSSAYRKLDSPSADRGDCVLLLGSRFKARDCIVFCNIEHVIIVVQMEDALSHPDRWVDVLFCLVMDGQAPGGCVTPEGSGSSLLHSRLDGDDDEADDGDGDG